jgi:hypothetical protein
MQREDMDMNVTNSVDKQHGEAAYLQHEHKKHKHAALTCRMDMLNGQA